MRTIIPLITIGLVLSACSSSTSSIQVGQSNSQDSSSGIQVELVDSSTLDWDDRSIFKKGLVESEQSILDELPGALIHHIYL